MHTIILIWLYNAQPKRTTPLIRIKGKTTKCISGIIISIATQSGQINNFLVDLFTTLAQITSDGGLETWSLSRILKVSVSEGVVSVSNGQVSVLVSVSDDEVSDSITADYKRCRCRDTQYHQDRVPILFQ